MQSHECIWVAAIYVILLRGILISSWVSHCCVALCCIKLEARLRLILSRLDIYSIMMPMLIVMIWTVFCLPNPLNKKVPYYQVECPLGISDRILWDVEGELMPSSCFSLGRMKAKVVSLSESISLWPMQSTYILSLTTAIVVDFVVHLFRLSSLNSQMWHSGGCQAMTL